MSMNLRTAGLATLIAASLAASAALAAEATDPHQRARQMIAPSSIAAAQAPSGAMGRLIAPPEYLDPHARAADLLKHDRRSLVPPYPGTDTARGGSSDSDPQHRARLMILGRDD